MPNMQVKKMYPSTSSVLGTNFTMRRLASPTARHGGSLLAAVVACVLPQLATTMTVGADALFAKYAAEAPPIQSGLYTRCWGVVSEALQATVPAHTSDGKAFGGALEAFVAPGPDDPASIPDDQRGLIEKLSDTAASYTQLIEPKRLSWGTCYRTLNRPLGAFFCGISLWPRTSVDVPNFTLYFGSGSAVNPKRVFMRLEMIPRIVCANWA